MYESTAAELSLKSFTEGEDAPCFLSPFYAEAEGDQRTYIPMGWMLVKEGSVEEGPEIHEVQETKLKLISPFSVSCLSFCRAHPGQATGALALF